MARFVVLGAASLNGALSACGEGQFTLFFNLEQDVGPLRFGP